MTRHEVIGRYFRQKGGHNQPAMLPTFTEWKHQLPSPLYDQEPSWVELYWAAWDIAFRNFHNPTAGSGFVSPFIDAAFNANIFLWDTCFMTMFCNYAYPLVPGISSLDNFYCKQHEDGEINREIDRTTGSDVEAWVNSENKALFSRWGWQDEAQTHAVTYRGRSAPHPNPLLTLDALDHPILAWAEVESYRVTGDEQRLAIVWEPLLRYYNALTYYLRQGNGLFVTDWASMDNSPRNPYLRGGGTGIDISSEMVLFARNMGAIASALGKQDEMSKFAAEADDVARRINEQMWDAERQFYFDVTLDGRRAPVKSVAAYWTLLAHVASPRQADALIAELRNPHTFHRLHRVPTLAADEPAYDPSGGYWRGAAWAPTTTMVLRGLEMYGHHQLAREIALNHMRCMDGVFRKTGSIWENYAPDAVEPGRPAKNDFVGWSGLGPIMYLLEYAVGLKPDARRNELQWTVSTSQRAGCRRFRFNGHVIDLVAEPDSSDRQGIALSIVSSGSFRLVVDWHGKKQSFEVATGKNEYTVVDCR